MDDLLTFLLGAGCILAVVTLVGHGIWVILAAAVRAMDGSNARSELPRRKPCPHCGAQFGVEQGKCLVCGAVPQVKPRSSLREELLATARQIKRLQARGALSQEQYTHLAALISADLNELDGKGKAAHVPGLTLLPDDQAVVAEVIDDPAATGTSRAPATAAAPHRLNPPADVSSPNDFVVVRSNVHSNDDDAAPYELQPLSESGSGTTNSFPSRGFGDGQPAQAFSTTSTAPLPPPPKLSDMLQSFLEESNIRWGEILAGFFIVVSSIGLVISLQATLEKIPYFPALLFTGFTVAFHGAGLYTLKRWNLHAISRVVLVISLLLVPLTASAAVLMSRRGIEEAAGAPPVMFWIVLAIGTVALTWVAYTASRELVGQAKWRLTLAVVGCSLAEVLVHRLEAKTFDFWQLSAVAMLPLGCFLIAVIGQLLLGRKWRHISWPRAQQTLIVLGVGLFALLVAVTMLMMKADPRWLAAARLAPTLSLAAGATMAVGLLIHRRTTAAALSGLRTAGTVILILGSAVMLLMVVLAWPAPELLLGVGLVNAAMLLALAFAADLALLYAPAIACLTLASVIGLHWAQGRFVDVPQERLGARIVEAGLMGRSSLVLLLIAMAVATAGEWLRRRKWPDDDTRVLFATGGVVALLGVLVATFAGFITVPQWSQDPNLAAPLLLMYAAALLVAAPFTPWPYVAAAGSVVLFAALLQAFAFNTYFRDLLNGRGLLPGRALLAALISHALVSSAALVGLLRTRLLEGAAEFLKLASISLRRSFVEPVAAGATVSLTAAIPLLFAGRQGQLFEAAIAAALASLGWLCVALATRWKPAVAGLQAMALAAPALAIAHYCHARLGADWLRSQDHLALQCAVLALGTAAWAILRRASSRQTIASELLKSPWPTVDEVALGVATLSTAVFAWLLILPGITWELGYELPSPLLKVGESTASLSPATWTLIASTAVVLALTASLWERVRLLPLVGMALATFALIAAGAFPWESSAAVASAVRWCAAAYTVAWGTVFIARQPIHLAARSLAWLRWERIDRATAHAVFGGVPMMLGALPILILTILAVLQSATGVELRGPAPGSFFDRIGPTAAYAVPLLAIVGVLLGYALRERETAFALGGSAVFQLAINLAFLLYVTFAPVATSEVRAAEWLQWNTVAAGGYAIVWLALLRWMLPSGMQVATSESGTRAGVMLLFQVAVAALGVAALTCWSAWSVATQPQLSPPERQVLGSALSYVSIGLVFAAATWLAILFEGRKHLSFGSIGLVLAAGLVAFVAATVDRYDLAREWLAYHTLTGGWLTVLIAGTIAVCTSAPRAGPAGDRDHWLAFSLPHHGLIAALGMFVAMLAIRGNLADPGEPWWSFVAIVGVLLSTTAIGLRRGSQPYAYASIAAAVATLALFWFAPAQATWRGTLGSDMPAVFIELLSLALLTSAAFWQIAEIYFQSRHNRSLDARFFGPRSHDTVLLGLLPIYFLWRLATATFANEPGDLLSYDDAAAIVAVVGLGVALTVSLWDRRAILTLPMIFGWSGIVALLAIGLVGPEFPRVYDRLALMMLSAGLLVAVAGHAWSYGANLSLIGLRLGISDPISGLKRTEHWLPVVSFLIAAITALATLFFVLMLPRSDVRTAVAFAPAAAAWGLACLADDQRRPYLRLESLLLAGLSAIYLSWAQLGIESSASTWLVRSFRLLMVLSILTFIYGLALPRWLLTAGVWNTATRKAGYATGVAAVAAFVGVLLLEVLLFEPGTGAPVDYPQVIAVAVVLVTMIAGLISMALLPGRDPLVLSEKGRQGYVYAALATAALLFAHLYVCRPMWFDAGLLPYWPLIVMAIAFVGAGGGELFARYRLTVLSEPLTRVSSMLPLLPVLGMWIVSPKETDYALVLLTVGVLYLILSVTQRSWASLLAAAVAGNGALWTLLNRSGFELMANPQLWIIPPALSVLLAAHVNRRRLPPTVLTSIRYACTLLIYVSSTSEIFLRGVATSLWPAMILATLSVAGAFVGMMLRIRAFLYLGASFAIVSLITMVAHAAQAIDHVWPWWAFGVGMGIAILVLFGIFEKQREEVLRLIARLRQWEQ